MKYVCLVYGEPSRIDAMSDSDLVTHAEVCMAWMDKLEKGGQHIYSTGLQSASTAATVRIRAGNLSVTDGPYAETKEVLGGLTVFEARDMNEAISIASKLDAARIGSVEVRPLLDIESDELSDPVDRRVARTIRDLIQSSSN